MTPSQILAIPVDQPWRLFKNPGTFKDEARALRKQWHSDINPDPKAPDVIAHVNVLIDFWESHPINQVPYLSKHKIPGVGEFMVQPNKVVYTYNKDSLYLRSNAAIKKFKFANDDMRFKIGTLLPKFKTVDPYELTFEKLPSQLNLHDVLESQKRLPDVHVAWILSRLYSLACYMSYSDTPHVDISLQNIYIDPELHSVHLYGGWEYALGFREKALGSPKRTLDLCRDFSNTHVPTKKLISTQIKEVGRTLLGAASISAMHLLKMPKPLSLWLTSPGKSDPILEYSEWGECLEKSFGVRKFIKWDLNEKSVYPSSF